MDTRNGLASGHPLGSGPDETSLWRRAPNPGIRVTMTMDDADNADHTGIQSVVDRVRESMQENPAEMPPHDRKAFR